MNSINEFDPAVALSHSVYSCSMLPYDRRWLPAATHLSNYYHSIDYRKLGRFHEERF